MKSDSKAGITTWYVMQGILMVLGWYGLHGHTHLWQSFVFLEVFGTITLAFVGFGKFLATLRSPQAAADFQKVIGKPGVSPAIRGTSDLLIATVCAGFGHYIVAAMMVVQIVSEQWLWSKSPRS